MLPAEELPSKGMINLENDALLGRARHGGTGAAGRSTPRGDGGALPSPRITTTSKGREAV